MDEKNGGTAARLKEERDRLGLSQPSLADLGNTKLRTLQNWEGGKNFPSSEFLAEAAKYGVDVTYVLTGNRYVDHIKPRGVMNPHLSPPNLVAIDSGTHKRALTGPTPAPRSDEDTIYIPLLSATGSMGPGADVIAADVVMGDVPVSLHWVQMNLPRCRPQALRLVHAYGDSMRGTLESGDFALVDTDVHSVEIDGVYVLEAHQRLFIKRVRQRMNGQYEVSSDNPAIKQTDVLSGGHEIRVCGMVVYGWNGRRF